jgi:hypothetical protein
MRESQRRFIVQLGYSDADVSEPLFTALMFQPRVLSGLMTLGIVLQSPFFFAAMWMVLWLSAFVPARNPFDAIYNAAIARPRGRLRLQPALRPRRAAQAMAGTMSLVITVTLLLGFSTAAWVFEGALLSAILLVVFGDFCPGAWIFLALASRSKAPATPPLTA